jgi:methionyl-tRNA formyltransferase
MKIIFMGTAAFSTQVLQALHAKHEVVLVVTQPDKPVGRKKIMTPSQVADFATMHNIPLLKPDRLMDALSDILQVDCDFIVTASFGQYVPTKILQHPRIKAINVHASLLPKYRGASPVHQAVLHGDKETGITYMEMVKEMDAGNYYHQESLTIDPSWTTSDVMDQLAQLAARTINPFLDQFESYSPIAQDLSKVSFAPKLTKEDGYVDFDQPASVILNQLRAFSKEPGCRFFIDDQEIKVFTATRCDDQGEAGTVLSVTDKGIIIACNDASIQIAELQLPGKTRQHVSEFIRGNTWLKAGMKGESPHGRS